MSWSEKYKKSIDCSNPKGFSQKAHCQGRKKRNETTMKISEFKEAVREISRNKFYESLNEAPKKFELGKQQYTKRGMVPVDIHSLTMDYVNLPVTRLQKKQDLMVNAFIDMKNLLGMDYNYSTKKFSKSSKPALMIHLLKNKLVDKKEYIDIYKKLTSKMNQLSKYVQNSANRDGRNDKAAEKQARKDLGFEGAHSFSAMSATRAALKRKKKK